MIRHPLDHLETIWQKPERTRKKIATVTVALLSILVVGIWLSTLSFDDFSFAQKSAAKMPPSPFSALRQMFSANPWSIIQSWYEK